ncbi:MAG: ABC transporter substrate-binding protein [Deltaproteobacteria bacterium]|nr:ABC transporter substrate-binding protein [Deltaproteobacteria bacterium]
MKNLTVCGLLFGFLLTGQPLPRAYADTAAAATQTQTSALNEVKKTLDEVIKVVTTYPTDKQLQVRRDKLREVINPRFDFEEMSKRSLGTYWKEITPEQQKEFVVVFSDLLARTYLSKIETVEEGMVKFDGEKVDFPRALVKTIVKYKGDNFPLDYKLLNEGGSWKVYDVVIENIGLVANYRNEFAGIIRKESFDGLMKKLREKSVA